MLTPVQRWIAFIILCGATVAAIVFEGYLLYLVTQDVVVGRNPGWLESVSAVLCAGVTVGLAHVFIAMLKREFLRNRFTPFGRLHKFVSERVRTIENAQEGQTDEYLTRQMLVTSTLKFAEECLNGWIPGSHFEASIFVDADQPLLFAYFDSNDDTTARTMAERAKDPKFYIKKRYEVTKLLAQPTSQPRMLKNTERPKTQYTFATDQQRKQIKSTMLLCFDVIRPSALVLTSNRKNAFTENNRELVLFARMIGEFVRSDLVDEGFASRIRALKPALFH